MNEIRDMNNVYQKLTRKSQLHLLELANVAMIAETSVKNEIAKNNVMSKETKQPA